MSVVAPTLSTDVAIIGGGACGLSLANALQQQGRDYQLFEARHRLGGRILTITDTSTSAAARFDMGATWFWPHTEPLMVSKIAELELSHFLQHDTGTVLSLDDSSKAASVLSVASVHAGARRLYNGMATLINAMAGKLPRDRIHVSHVLSVVAQSDGGVELHFIVDDHVEVVMARCVVLALPPRLVAERIRFIPSLDSALQQVLHNTPTWMAAHAKAVVRYEAATWRSLGQSGSAFVRHDQTTCHEIFDACDASGKVAALGAFIKLSPQLRRSFQVGLPMLIGNQMQQVFGNDLVEAQQHYQDWVLEPFTCAGRDIADGNERVDATPPIYGGALLRESHWQGRLYFGGTETAPIGGGHVEGALQAAERIQLALTQQDSLSSRQTTATLAAIPITAASSASPQLLNVINTTSLAQFRAWVRDQREAAFDDYRRRINLSLALQERDQLTQRAMLGAMEKVLHDAIDELQRLPFDSSEMTVERGRNSLTPQVQAAFDGLMQHLLDSVTMFNGTSCALSNFPGEDRLSSEYTQTILRDIAAAWREFSLDANAVLNERLHRALPPLTANVAHFPSDSPAAP